MRQSTSIAAIALLGSTLAAPTFDGQTVFGVKGGAGDQEPPSHPIPQKPDTGMFNPLHHLSALSPYYVPSKEITPLPNPTCNVTTTSILIRHSAIMSNDDDREEFMQPFIDKVAGWESDVFPQPPAEWNMTDEIKRWKREGTFDGDVGERKWWFLSQWKTPIEEKIDEKLSDRGKEDAFAFGQAVRSSYSHLFPAPHTGKPHKGKKPVELIDMLETSEFDELFEPKHHHGHHKKDKHHRKHKHHHDDDDHKKKRPSKDPKHKKPSPPYKIWTASSERDIETATSWIKGAFPRNQTGKEGEGDGYHVQLVKVPNKLGKGWKRSLTPHKACEAFDKKPSLEKAAEWLHVFAPRIQDRLQGVVPKVVERISDEDVLSMFMLCAYESIDQGWSGWCGVFTEEEFRDAEYYFDVRFHYMMGYGNELSPILGAPWIKTARHLMAGEVEDDRKGHSADHMSSAMKKKKNKKGKKEKKPGDGLPEPTQPPNGTHSQLLHAFFTHRESPAFSSTVLNLYNSTDEALGPSAFLPPPTDHRPEPRQWRTSEMVSYLSHIALERFSCAPGSEGVPISMRTGDDEDEEPSFVRAMVNGQQANMHGCESGPAQSCAWEEWKEWIDDRLEQYSDWEGNCDKEEDDE